MGGTRDFLSGMMWGGLVGAAIGLLIAPRSGDETRALLRERSEEFKSQAYETADNLRDKATETAEQARARATELQQRGRELIDENKDRIVRTAEAVKQSAKEAYETPRTGGAAPEAGATGQGQRPAHGAQPERSDRPARGPNVPGPNTPQSQGGSGI